MYALSSTTSLFGQQQPLQQSLPSTKVGWSDEGLLLISAAACHCMPSPCTVRCKPRQARPFRQQPQRCIRTRPQQSSQPDPPQGAVPQQLQPHYMATGWSASWRIGQLAYAGGAQQSAAGRAGQRLPGKLPCAAQLGPVRWAGCACRILPLGLLCLYCR